jgi:hypothetical protein
MVLIFEGLIFSPVAFPARNEGETMNSLFQAEGSSSTGKKVAVTIAISSGVRASPVGGA